MILILSSVFFTTLIVAIILFPNTALGIRARYDLPGPPGYPLIGNVPQVIPNKRRMIRYMEQLYKIYGPVSTLTLPGWGRIVIINNAHWLAHVKKHDTVRYSRGNVAVSVFKKFPGILTPVASEGDEWRHSRKVIQPIFGRISFQNHLMAAMDGIVPILVGLLGNVASECIAVDWNDISGRLALSLFCTMSFGVNTDMLRKDTACLKEQDVFIDAVSELNDISAGRLFNPYWHLSEKFDGTSRKFDTTIRKLWIAVEQMISERKQALKADTYHATTEATDFLSNLLNNSENLDPLFVRNIMVTLLFGGRDNTQNSIAWSLYELMRHPEWVDKMRKEAEEVGASGRPPSFSTLSSYPIHLAVFHETVRLWPGLPKNARFALDNDVLPGIPEESLPEVRIDKGTYVLWSDEIIMKYSTSWGSDPVAFNPGRHLTADGKFIKPSLADFVTFGAGPRHCPAASIVPYEWICIWTSLLPLFDFEALDTSKRSSGDFLTNQMSHPFLIRVIPRNT
ncbi:hypothetical protein PM082_013840 [Marasmius tenuissimus]|nr:hypothetical protein PM082_013840 [Marasmius tenuissimus]